ncbi:MAG: zinc ribbon domain-containing protein [Candidatus Bathyarchaeia archaeon]
MPFIAGKRRRADSFPNITRAEFAELLERARSTQYPFAPELSIRDASLLAFEFLFKTRVSEGLGRIYPEDRRTRERSTDIDIYEGVKVSDFQVATVQGKEVLRCRFRVLKRGRRKKVCPSCDQRNALDSHYCRKCGSDLSAARYSSRLKEIYVWDSVRLDDPFTIYILEWLNYLREHGHLGRVWEISRQRAWQIMRKLGIMNHTQRHFRASQLADVLDPFELKEALHRETIPVEYVHRAEGRRIAKEEEADKIWS